MTVSVVIPTLNEAAHLRATVAAARAACPCEIIVVDGGSSDGTAALGRQVADQVLVTQPSRARQMNAGAAAARGDVLVFVHADTLLPPEACHEIEGALRRPGAIGGRFDLRIEGRPRWGLALTAVLINARSRLTGGATGDQAIFVRRDVFQAEGGYPDLPLCEDLALVRRLRRHGRMVALRALVTTSGRRWERNGFLRTVLLMWTLRLLFLLGVSPARLARAYGEAR